MIIKSEIFLKPSQMKLKETRFIIIPSPVISEIKCDPPWVFYGIVVLTLVIIGAFLI